MYIVIFCSIICVCLTYLEEKQKLKHGMLYGFILITTLGVIHYDYGTDYLAYYNYFKELSNQSLSLRSIINEDYRWEVGWVFLNYYSKYIGGFFVLVALLNIFQNYVYYSFIKENVATSKTLAVATYVFSTSLYVLNFSMMRQGLAIALVVFSWKYIKKKEFIPALVILFLATLVHKSSQILLPLAFWGYIKNLNARTIAFSMLGLFVVLYASSSFLSDILLQILSIEMLASTDSFDYYMKANEDKLSFGVGFLLNLLPFICGIYVLTKQKFKDNHYPIILIGLLQFVVAPFCMILPLLGRYAYYFSAFQIASVPITYNYLSNKMVRQSVLLIYIVMLLFSYWNFFNDIEWADAYDKFNTIFNR